MRALFCGGSVWVLSSALSVAAFGRDLSFEQRVKAEEALARVYYVHQVGGVRPFEVAVPHAVLERKVKTYLRQSAALEEIWKTPVTGAMLDRELARITESTRLPGRLLELYEALDNDPFVIRECLVRPALVERLAHDLFDVDETIHAAPREAAERLRRGLLQFGPAAFDGDPQETVVDIAPARTGTIGAVLSERDAYALAIVLDDRLGSARIARFTVPKVRWEDWWRGQEGRFDARGVRAVASAGPVGSPKGASGDSWDGGSLDGLARARPGSARAWTGSVMVVWGGDDGALFDTGAIYDPATDAWRTMSTAGAPPAMSRPIATWTGSQVIVREADDTGKADVEGRYDPWVDTWFELGGGRDDTAASFDRRVAPIGGVRVNNDPAIVAAGPESPRDPQDGLAPGEPPRGIIQEMSAVSESPTGLVFPVVTPVFSELFFGAQGGDFGYCERGPNARAACGSDADCEGETCGHTLDNTMCLAYNTDCKGMRRNRAEYGFNDVLEATYDSSPAIGRQTWIERNWNYISAEGEFWRPFHFALEVDANSTCVGGTNAGALCTLLDEAGTCDGGGTCTGAPPSGGARWTFTPNNRRGNSSLQLRWPWAAVNARLGTDPYYASGFSSWMRSSDFDPKTTASGAFFKTFLNHANDRRGPWQNGVYSVIEFGTDDIGGAVSWVNAGFFDARLSGSVPQRKVAALTGVRSEVNLGSTSSSQALDESYGLFVQFNPSGLNIKDSSHTGVFIGTPTAPGAGTVIAAQNGLWIADQQLVRSGGGGSAILVSAQTASDGSEGNVRLDGANWNSGHIQLASGHLWRDPSASVLRYKDGAPPRSESDGSAALTGTGSDSHGVVLWGVASATDPSFDTGAEVCAESGLACVETSEFTTTAIGCDIAHTARRWIAFCK